MRVQFSDLQRLKAQDLLRRAEGQPGLAEERVDEFGPALDGPEPAADRATVRRILGAGAFSYPVKVVMLAWPGHSFTTISSWWRRV